MNNKEFYNLININYVTKKYKESKPCLILNHFKTKNKFELLLFLLNYEHSVQVAKKSAENPK